MTVEPMIVETATSKDDRKAWALERREDGLFVYSEMTLFSVELGSGELEEYWSPSHFSGLFDTAEAAKADALGTLPWLRETGPTD